VVAWRTAKSARLAASIDERTPAHPPLLPSIIAGAIVGCLGRDWYWRRHLRRATGTHFALAKHAARGRAIGNLQFLNSAAALAGLWRTSLITPPQLPTWLVAVGTGAIVGSWLGVKHLPAGLLRRKQAAPRADSD
jgi:uncharacterized protein